MVAKATVFLTGKVYWAKVIGEPRPNFGGDAREWTLEFEPDAEGVKTLKAHKLGDRLKDKYVDQGRGEFITLKKPEFNKEGKPNQPIRVYNKDDEPWGDSLIGNGSAANIKLDIRDYGPGKKRGVYPVALRINELVEYQSSEFGALDGDKPKNQGKEPNVDKDFGVDLNDEVPF